MTKLELNKIRYIKSELENYYFIMRIASSKFIKVSNLEEQCQIEPDTCLDQEIKTINQEIDMLLARTGIVDKFINKLSAKDKEIIYNLHMAPDERKQYDYYCHEVGMARSTLHRHVNRLIIKHWET